MKLSVILLAAGLSERMGEDKLLFEFNKISMLERAINLINKIEAYEKVIVTTEPRIKKAAVPDDIKVIINPDPGKGLSSSIKLGVKNSKGTHYLFMAADQPKLRVNDIAPIINSVNKHSDKIIYPLVGGEPCMPAVFPSSFYDELISLKGDEGGKVLREKYPQLCVGITAENPKNFADIDTKENYALF